MLELYALSDFSSQWERAKTAFGDTVLTCQLSAIDLLLPHTNEESSLETTPSLKRLLVQAEQTRRTTIGGIRLIPSNWLNILGRVSCIHQSCTFCTTEQSQCHHLLTFFLHSV